MTSFLTVFSFFLLLAFCGGVLHVLPVKNHASVCMGDSVSLELEISGAQGQTAVQWTHEGSFLDDSEHFSLNENRTALDINNALPHHAGSYYAVVSDGVSSEHAIFNVEVHDIYLRTLVKSPVHIEFGGKSVLRVEKSEGGVLWWIHHGNLIRGQDSHYKFLDTQDSTGTELVISDAGEEQGGFYEVVLKQAGCEIRNIIDVQVEVHLEETAETDTAGDTKLWGIIDYKYLKVFSGDFTGEWYVVPAALGPVVILLLVLMVCLIRKALTRKRLKKEKTTAEMESGVPHVLFQEPLYSMQDQVFYPAATPGYDITPVTSSHPQSSTLGAYDNMSMYSVGMPTVMSNYDLLGPSVPPPTSELKETHSAMDAEIYGWSDED